MDYTEFCYYNEHVTSLTKLEIETPYLVIDELCRKRTMEAFHSDLWILQSTIYKDNEWKKYNPINLYTTYEDIIRLLDTVFLINEHNPELSTILKPPIKVKSNNEQIIAINNLFKKKLSENKHQGNIKIINPETVISDIYSNHDLQILKEDLFNCLQIGLDVSYMDTSKHEYFGGCDNDYALLFRTLEDLITEMYQIHLKDASVFPSLSSCSETKFATDSEHPSQLFRHEIEKPYSTFFHFYHRHINHEHIYTGLSAWKQLLFEKKVWETEQNPGNLLHLNQCLIELIDIVWLLIQNNQLEEIKEDYTAKKRYKKLINVCNTKELNTPIIAIENFMTYKKMHEWKALLHTWLKCSLDNDPNYLTEDREQIDLEFNLLIKFAEAVSIISLAPIK